MAPWRHLTRHDLISFSTDRGEALSSCSSFAFLLRRSVICCWLPIMKRLFCIREGNIYKDQYLCFISEWLGNFWKPILLRTVHIICQGAAVNFSSLVKFPNHPEMKQKYMPLDFFSFQEKATLQVGDEILKVNEHHFRHLGHEEAVSVLKTTRDFKMVVLRVGKVPHAATAPPGPPPTNQGLFLWSSPSGGDMLWNHDWTNKTVGSTMKAESFWLSPPKF